MQEQLQKLAVSKQEVLHCLGIVGAGFLYSLGINLFVVPAGLYTGGIMGFAQLLRTFFLYLTGLELKIDTSPSGLDAVTALLEQQGVTGLMIDDETDFQDFLEHNRQYWDYVDDALEAVGMTQFVKHAPHLLSGGQKQRIAIAGVLAMKPECIVLDEATAMLDPIGRREVLAAVEKLNREQGITVVLITHHMNEAEHADRVIVMNEGRVAMDGAPREVFAQVEKLKSIDLTVPDTVELLYELRGAGCDLPLTAITVDECADAIARCFGKSAKEDN